MRRRGVEIERVFAMIKSIRGLNKIRMKKMQGAKSEVNWMVASYNLGILLRYKAKMCQENINKKLILTKELLLKI